jgi:hypothetical protein
VAGCGLDLKSSRNNQVLDRKLRVYDRQKDEGDGEERCLIRDTQRETAARGLDLKQSTVLYSRV